MFEYEFDFSKEDDINEIDDKNDIFGQLISEALKEMKSDKKPKTINPEGENKFFQIQNNLFYIAKKNNAKMTIKGQNTDSRVSIELEADVLDFDTEKLKKLFIDNIELSKFITIERRTNGKFAIVAEIIINNDNSTKF